MLQVYQARRWYLDSEYNLRSELLGLFAERLAAEVVTSEESQTDALGKALRPVTEATIYENADEYRKQRITALQASALSKLTADERTALGY